MAKKKGGGGADASKKSQQKKKQQIVEDKTFGLKNKNKSKKVQQQIESVKKNVMNSGDPKLRKLEEQRQKAKAEAKLRKKAQKEEQDALFNEALMAVSKKGSTSQKDGKVEAKGRDADAEEGKKSTSRAMKMMYQMDAQEMNDKLREDPNYVPTLEDEIELQRSQLVEDLKKRGQKGTPVTPETFAAWQDRKRKARAEAARKKVEAEFKKKKGGKGLSVLSGRDLYEYKQELFADKEEEDGDDENENDAGEGPTGMSRQSSAVSDSNSNHGGGKKSAPVVNVEQVAEKVQSDLFLEGDDDDLDDIEDD